jgi:hypothetical protein
MTGYGGHMGHREVPTTRYFAIGFFTAEGLERKHRAMLARAAQPDAAVPRIQSAIASVHITIFRVDTGTETVEMGVDRVAMEVVDPNLSATSVSFKVERFDADKFPGDLKPQAAFKAYLASPDGISNFGTATAVQLFSIDVGAKDDLNPT